jgi:hypothetical protein
MMFLLSVRLPDDGGGSSRYACNNDGIRLDFTEIFKKVRKALMLSTGN